jgi:putative transposase
MSHTYSQNVVHIVFSTKERRKSIPAEFRAKLWAYAAGICKRHGILVYAIGGMEDHVHLLMQVPPSLALAKAVAAIKANSARWANEGANKIEWQEGYGAFSVSASNVPTGCGISKIGKRITGR